MGVAVVVEVDEDVGACCVPFLYPVDPPCEVVVAVGACIQVMVIRAVHLYVREVSRDTQYAGQVRWPELDEQHGALVAQLVPSFLDALHPLFRRTQPPSVRKTPWCLDRQAESIGNSLPPAAEHRRPRPAVEAAVKLSRSERGRITGQPVTGR